MVCFGALCETNFCAHTEALRTGRTNVKPKTVKGIVGEVDPWATLFAGMMSDNRGTRCFRATMVFFFVVFATFLVKKEV